jgi:WD40 repeat protein
MVNRVSAIEAKLSQGTVRFKPGGQSATFAVEVFNTSDRFATLLLDINAPGTDPADDARWYRLSPEVGTKTPPGDRTLFHVEIFRNPVPGFVGTMNLTVRILSLELQEEDRQLVRLVVEPGVDAVPLALALPAELSADPDAALAIPVTLHNPGVLPVKATLQALGLPVTWAIAATTTLVNPGETIEVDLRGQIPPADQGLSQPYPFTLTALQDDGLTSSAEGTVHLRPRGYYSVTADPTEQDLPGEEGDRDTATFTLAVTNASNLAQQVALAVTSDTLAEEAIAIHPATAIPLTPGDIAHLQIQAVPKRPLVGPPRHHRLSATAQLSDPRLEVRQETEVLTLWVKPRIPFLLQILGVVGLALLLLLPVLIKPQGHRSAVSTVQFSGDADRVVSGSADQTLRRWRVVGKRLKPDGVLARLDKAVRVVALRPVGNNLVAAGLENGEITLWNVLSPGREPLHRFVSDRANRVLSLAFTPDAHYLFSSHGSGAVMQWAVGDELAGRSPSPGPVKEKPFDFAVYALARVDQRGQWLAVAGRYNRLVLWNWQTDETYQLLRQEGDQNAYIQSLASPELRPHRLAAADNQGRIRLWDVSRCVTVPPASDPAPDCATLLETWGDGHSLRSGDPASARPVRALAYSLDGCYLASVGDDRRVMLWPLGSDGRRDPGWQQGQVMRTARQPLNTVDVVLSEGQLLVSSGGNDDRVYLDARPVDRFRTAGPGHCDLNQ